MGARLRREHVEPDAVSKIRSALRIYFFLVQIVTAFSVAVYAYWGQADTFPLFTAQDRFRDLTNYYRKTAHLYHGAAALAKGIPVFNYPAPGAFVFKWLLRVVPGQPVLPYLAFMVLCGVGFAVAGARASGRNSAVSRDAIGAIMITALAGYPFWFTVDRCNIEGVVWALAGAGLCFLLRRRYGTAALLIGLSAAVKPFSGVFLLLLVRRGRYKEAAFGVLTTLSVVLAALIGLGPNPITAYQELKPGMALYVKDYVMNLRPAAEERFSHSLLDGMKSVALTVEMGGIHPVRADSEVPKLASEPGGWHVVPALVRTYAILTAAGFVLLLVFFYRMPVLNQITALAAFASLSPPNSAEYTLLQLYVPFGAFVVFLTREVASGRVRFAYTSMLGLAVIYGLLFAPLSFLRIYDGDAKLLLLLGLLYVVARSPMPSRDFGDAQEEAAGATQ